MARDVIIPLDFPDAETAIKFLGGFGEKKPFVKIGMELYYSAGPDFAKRLKGEGYKLFIDLKLFDIPNTVKGAAASLRAIGADIVNVHALGGTDMMRAAREGLGSESLLIAVTILTSTSPEMLRSEMMIPRELPDAAAELARIAQEAGLDGVVCSPHEAAGIKAGRGQGFLTVTPGIRFADSAADDQSRIATPASAREMGSDYIVVGRPITKAADPVAAYERCVKEFVG